jgi:MBG domain-containing protein
LFGAANPPLTYTIGGLVNGDSAGVVSGTAACATTALAASPGGSYPISCAQGSLAAANYNFAFAADTLTVGYTGSCLTGSHSGALTVAKGQALCLGPGFRQSGQLNVQAGGALDIRPGASISGPLSASGATALRACGAKLTGPVTVSKSTGLVVMGDDEGPACAGNTITGPVSLTTNSGGVEFDSNTVNGPLTITGTTGTVPPPDTGSLVHAGDTVTGPVHIN